MFSTILRKHTLGQENIPNNKRENNGNEKGDSEL
jgi:hypothetical protein